MGLNESMMSLRQKLNPLLVQRSHLAQKVKEERKSLEEAKKKVEDCLTAQQITQEVAETLQQSAQEQISRVVSRCLQTIFGKRAYEFKIRFSKKRGRTEAELLFLRDNKEVDPLTASGGGAIDIAAFALRLAALVLIRPRRRRLIVADEPFRFVSEGYRDKVRLLLETLSQEMGIQFVIVTHDPELVVGKEIEL